MGRERSQSKKGKEVSPKTSPRQEPLSPRELFREAGRTLSSRLSRILGSSDSGSSPDPSSGRGSDASLPSDQVHHQHSPRHPEQPEGSPAPQEMACDTRHDETSSDDNLGSCIGNQSSSASISETEEVPIPQSNKLPSLDFSALTAESTIKLQTPRFIDTHVSSRTISFETLAIEPANKTQTFFKSSEPTQWYDDNMICTLWDKKRYILLDALGRQQLIVLQQWFDGVISVAFKSVSTMTDPEYQAFVTHCSDTLKSYRNQSAKDLMVKFLKKDDEQLELCFIEIDQEIQKILDIHQPFIEHLEKLNTHWSYLTDSKAALDIEKIKDILNLEQLKDIMTGMPDELIKSVQQHISHRPNTDIYLVKDSQMYEHITSAVQQALDDKLSVFAMTHCRETLLSSQLLNAMTKPVL